MLFGPRQDPWSVFARELSGNFVGSIVAGDPCCKIICVANVETAFGISEDVHPKH